MAGIERMHDPSLECGDVRAVLDIPADVNTWAMIPMGYPTGRWGEATRRPVRDVTYWDSWRNPPPD